MLSMLFVHIFTIQYRWQTTYQDQFNSLLVKLLQTTDWQTLYFNIIVIERYKHHAA